MGRLHELANQHKMVRQGHSDFMNDTYCQTVIDNISLPNSELLAEVRKLVVKTGHEVAKKTLTHPCEAGVVRLLWKPMSITDLNLLWERCMARQLDKVGASISVVGRSISCLTDFADAGSAKKRM